MKKLNSKALVVTAPTVDAFKLKCVTAFIKWLHMVLIFIPLFTLSQVKYRETSFVGGVSGDGVSDPLNGAYTFIPNIPAGSTVTKAIMFGGRHGPIYDANFNLTNALKFSLAGDTFQFNMSNQVSPTFQSPIYGGNSGVHAVDVTATLATILPAGYPFKKIHPYSSASDKRYTDFYLYVEYQHPSLTATTYTAIFVNNANFDTYVNYTMTVSNPIKNTSDVGMAFFGGYTCNNTSDGTKVDVNGTYLGDAGNPVPPLCEEGFMGDFYIQNGVFSGIGDDVADQKIKDRDAISNIKNIVSNGATSVTAKFTHQGIAYPPKNTQDNAIWAVFLVYSESCVQPTVSLPPTITTCNAQTSIDAGNGGTSYTWSNGATTQSINVNTSGQYIVTVTNASGCSKSDTVQVTVNALPQIDLGNDTTVCTGSMVLDAANNGFNYMWSNGATTQSITATSNGTYGVIVTDNNGCSATDNISISFSTAPVVTLGPDVVSCSKNVQLSASTSGLTYLWNTGETNQNINATSSGTYSVTATNANGCSASSSIQVVLDSVAKPNLGNNVSTCATQYTLNAGGNGLSYLWNTTQITQSINVTTSGTYSVVVTNANGCTNSASVNVVLNATPTVSLGADVSICDDEYTLNAGNTGFTYSWNTGATTQTITAVTNGVYSVTISDGTGCTATDSILVTLGTIPAANAGADVIIESGNNTILNGAGGGSYTWTPNTTLSCANCTNPVASPTVTTNYILLVTNSNGCTSTDTVTVFVSEECNEVSFFLPTAFSPNNDTQNDILFLRATCIVELNWYIYNRWGEKVFETNDPKAGWDGTWHGQACDAGVFVYYIYVTTFNGNTITRSGNITLVKQPK